MRLINIGMDSGIGRQGETKSRKVAGSRMKKCLSDWPQQSHFFTIFFIIWIANCFDFLHQKDKNIHLCVCYCKTHFYCIRIACVDSIFRELMI